MLKNSVFLLFACLLSPLKGWAFSTEAQWNDLVFSVGGVAQVRSTDFYLADTTVPVWENEEKRRTLDLKDAPYVEGEKHPRCKYPARYFWLGLHAEGAPWLPPSFCEDLNTWVDLQQLQSIELLFVSGYLSNPASTFGHTLLNIQTSQNSGFRMLETSVNFGAIIPENEGVLAYLSKGLFGGYLARFSDGDYAANDQTYQTKEMRPIWRLRLNLDAQQFQFITLLIAERTGVKLDYFFLSDNCAWYMARLLELGIGVPLEAPPRPTWYAPIELVHTLHRQKNPANGELLVAQSQYEPSQQQLLQARLSSLPEQHQADYKRLIQDPPLFLREDGSVIHSPDALDAALTYWEIKNLATETSGFAAQKDAVLKARLALPAKPRIVGNVTALPTENLEVSQPVSQFGVGVQHSRLGHTEYTLRLAPYEQSNLTLHALGSGKELTVLNGQARLNGSSASLEFLELIRVSSTSQPDVTGLSPLGGRLAWGFNTGLKVLETDPEYRARREAGGIAGQDFYGDLKYGLSKASNTGALLLGVYTGMQLSTGEHAVVPRLELAGQYRLGTKWVANSLVEYKNAYDTPLHSVRDRRVFFKNHLSWAASRDDRWMLGLWHSDLDTGLNFSFNSKY